jgi:beta-glucosidase
VINTCIQYGVKPIVTLYHWDLPLYLQNLYGGWLSEEIVDDFAAYAKVVFERYGNRVPHWFTLNEPIVFCDEYPVSYTKIYLMYLGLFMLTHVSDAPGLFRGR